MITVDKFVAADFIKSNGTTGRGEIGYCLVRFQNRLKYDIPGVDLEDPDSEINCFDYALIPNRSEYESFLNQVTVDRVDVLWGSERYKTDEIDIEKDELDSGSVEMLKEMGMDYLHCGDGTPRVGER